MREYNVYMYVNVCISMPICVTYTVYQGRNDVSWCVQLTVSLSTDLISTSGLHLLTSLWLIPVLVASHTFHHVLLCNIIWS